MQPETVVSLNDEKRNISDKRHAGQDNGYMSNTVQREQHYHEHTIHFMIPFTTARFQNEPVDIFDGNVIDMVFGKAVFSNVLGEIVFPLIDFMKLRPDVVFMDMDLNGSCRA